MATNRGCKVYRKQAYFIATNRGHKVCQNPTYFIATNIGYKVYGENKQTIKPQTVATVCRKQAYIL